MVYPACSIRKWLVTGQESYFRTTIVKLGGSISTTCLSAGCVVLLACGTLSAQTKSKSSLRIGNQSTAKLQTVSAHPDFQQEQEIAQERKVEQAGAAEDRPHARPRNPGSADSRTLSRWHCLRNLGREIAERHAALPGGQWLAKQVGPGFPGIDQDGIGPRPRAPVESGKRDDVATRSAPRCPMLEQTPPWQPSRRSRRQTSDLRPQNSDLQTSAMYHSSVSTRMPRSKKHRRQARPPDSRRR